MTENKSFLAETLDDSIEAFVSSIMNRAITRNHVNTNYIHTFLKYSPELLCEEGYPFLTYLKKKVSDYIRLLFLTECIFVDDCTKKKVPDDEYGLLSSDDEANKKKVKKSEDNLTDAEQIILLYFNLMKEHKSDLTKYEVKNRNEYNNGTGETYTGSVKKLKSLIKQYMASNSIATPQNEKVLPAHEETSSLQKIQKYYKSEFSEASLNQALPFLSLNIRGRKKHLPVSFYPYIGFISDKSRKDFLFNKTRRHLDRFSDSLVVKDATKFFNTISGLYNSYNTDLDFLLNNAYDAKDSYVEANRFLVNNMLHREFFGSLNSQLFEEISRRIDVIEIKNMQDPYAACVPYRNVSTSESIFYLRLLELMMLFDLNLEVFDQYPFYSDEFTGFINTISDGMHGIRNAYQDEVFCIESSIAFTYSMRFLHTFLSLSSREIGPFVSSLFDQVKMYQSSMQTALKVAEEIMPEKAKDKRKDLSEDYNKNQRLIITYLLNKGGYGSLFD